MKKYFVLLVVIGSLVGINYASAGTSCLCLSSIDAKNFVAKCHVVKDKDYCETSLPNADYKNQGVLCTVRNSEQECEKYATAKLQIRAEKERATKTPSTYGETGSIIPPCALSDRWDPSSKCGDISIFVILLINVSEYLFGIIGALALAMFIYAGFILIMSEGNSERIKKGGSALVSAAVGLMIAFGGYALIKFLGEAIGVTTNLL